MPDLTPTALAILRALPGVGHGTGLEELAVAFAAGVDERRGHRILGDLWEDGLVTFRDRDGVRLFWRTGKGGGALEAADA